MKRRSGIILGAVLVGTLMSMALPGNRVNARFHPLAKSSFTVDNLAPQTAADGTETTKASLINETAELAQLQHSAWDPSQKLSRLTHFSTPAAATMRDDLLRQWMETDLPDAARWVAQLPPGPGTTAAQRQIAIALTRRDLTSAVDWVTALPDSRLAPLAPPTTSPAANRPGTPVRMALSTAMPPM